MAYDRSVRTLMNNNGYDNSKIGYNQDSGYVTYGGQNFMKPQMNVNGTTYTDQSTFDNAHNQYKQSTTDPTKVYASGQPITTTQPTNQGYTNPYTQQITDILSRINTATQAPPVDVYSSPQYAAAQAQAQRGVAEGQRQSRENLNRRGILDSSLTSSQANQISANSNEYLTTQLVPQIQAQLQAQRQQELQNQQALFNNYFSLSGQADNQHNADRTYDAGRQDAATSATGYYTPDANTLSSVRKQMEANSAAYATASPDQQKKLHEDNLKLAASIGGNDTTGDGDYSYGPMRTIQGKQVDRNIFEGDRDYESKLRQEHLDLANYLSDKYGVQVDPKDDPALAYAQVEGLTPISEQERMAKNKQIEFQNSITQQKADTPSYSSSRSANSPSSVSAEEKKVEKDAAASKTKMDKESKGLVAALRNGQVDITQARKTIEEDLNYGFYTPEEADQLYKIIELFVGNNTPSITQTANTLMNPLGALKGR